MDKLKMQSRNVVGDNVEKIAALFPQCVTEGLNKDGKPELAIDFDKLRAELSNEVLDDGEERYQFTWPDKRAASRLANEPVNFTLRPCREESIDFDTTENLYIEGDNLDVLKVLRETYLGRVKMIYIDPPYNTGNDFVYNDDFAQGKEDFEQGNGAFDADGNQMHDDPMQRNTEANGRFHTDWLNMIYPRLKVARDLLTEDGVIFISMDDSEIENLTKVCNEVFGEQNFIGQWNWFKSATPPNLSKKIKKNIEYIVAYQKGENHDVFRGVQKTSSSDDPITKPQNSIKTLVFKPGTLHAKFKDTTIQPGVYGTDKFPNQLLDELHIVNGVNFNEVRFANRFIWLQDTLERQIKEGTRINLSKSLVISYKKAAYNAEVPPNFIDEKVGVETTENAGRYLDTLIGPKIFDYPKPVSLMAYFINFFIEKDENAIILDFFSGSGSTAESVISLNSKDKGNRRFIMVQLPEKTDADSNASKAGYANICEIGKERIRRAGKKIREEAGQAAEGLDTGFRVLKLDSSNMEDVFYTPDKFEPSLLDSLVDNIKEDRSGEDLLFQVMLNLGIDLSSKIERKEVAGKEVFSVDDDYLLACFDTDVNETTIEEMAKLLPTHLVIRDASAANDNVLDNFDQIIESYSNEKKITTHIL